MDAIAVDEELFASVLLRVAQLHNVEHILRVALPRHGTVCLRQGGHGR